jgi:hypothetical protein
MYRAGTADRSVLIPVTGLSPAGEVQSAPATPLLGPSLRPEVRGVEPGIAERRVTGPPMAPAPNNTIVISTLALVLIAVLVTVLVLD